MVRPALIDWSEELAIAWCSASRRVVSPVSPTWPAIARRQQECCDGPAHLHGAASGNGKPRADRFRQMIQPNAPRRAPSACFHVNKNLGIAAFHKNGVSFLPSSIDGGSRPCLVPAVADNAPQFFRPLTTAVRPSASSLLQALLATMPALGLVVTITKRPAMGVQKSPPQRRASLAYLPKGALCVEDDSHGAGDKRPTFPAIASPRWRRSFRQGCTPRGP